MAIDFKNIPSPCYLLDEQRLRNNLEHLRKVEQQAGINMILAFKGFAMWEVFPIIREYLTGAAASSLHEARLCAEEMKEAAHTYSPAFKKEEFPAILDCSKSITFNSLSQYRELYPLIRELKPSCAVGLRVNPEYSDVKTGLYNPALPGSRLGVTAGHLKEGMPEGITGLHFHTLCESGSQALEKTLLALEEKFVDYLPQMEWVNMGGGHLITGNHYDTGHLIHILRQFKDKHQLEVILEPGAAYAWQTGYLVSRVIDVVENHGVKTAMLDVSFTAHMPDTLEMPYKPGILGAREEISGKHTYRMGGNSCLSGDYHGTWSFDKPLKPGDPIIFKDMMHYTMVKTTTFNGVKHPSIGMWTTGNEFKLIREFSYEDYKNRLS